MLSGQTYRPITNSFKSGHIAVTGPTYTRFSLTKRLSGRVWLSRLGRPPTPPSTHPQQQQPPRFSFITGSSVCGALARIHPCAVELPDSWQTCNRSLCFFFFFFLCCLFGWKTHTKWAVVVVLRHRHPTNSSFFSKPAHMVCTCRRVHYGRPSFLSLRSCFFFSPHLPNSAKKGNRIV